MHEHAFFALADARPGLIRRALDLSGMTFLQFLDWLKDPAHAAAFAKVVAEAATGHLAQAVEDLAMLLMPPKQ